MATDPKNSNEENAILNSRLAELQGRYLAAVKNNEALMAERNELVAENAASEEVIETLTQDRDAWAEEFAALTYQNRKLREALEQYADEENWRCSICSEYHEHRIGNCKLDWWQIDGDGWHIARTALGKEEPTP